MDAGTKPTDGKRDGLPVPEWIPRRETWFGSFTGSLKEVFGPRRIIRIKKVAGGAPPPYRAPEFNSHVSSWKESFREGIREIFDRRPAPAAGAGGTGPFPVPGLTVDFGSWRESFRETIRQIFKPEKLPPLPKEAANIHVDDGSGTSKEDTERTRRTHALSILTHATVLVLITMPFFQQMVAQTAADEIVLEPLNLDLGLPPAVQRSQGGGGGGSRDRLKSSIGRPPKFALEQPLAPPSVRINNPDPALAVTPSVVAPENLQLANLDITQLGDPLSDSTVLSDGTGALGGIGSGIGGGVGMGSGLGLGEGAGGGYGGGYYQVGGSVSQPVCVYCPEPEFTEEARKAKYSGVVVLWAVVGTDGRASRIRVVKSVGLGLDEEAIRVVKTYIFRPAERFGKPVPVAMSIEVNFTLY